MFELAVCWSLFVSIPNTISLVFRNSSTSLVFTLAFLGIQHLQANHFFNHPDILRLALHDGLQVLQALTQILDLALVKILRPSNVFLDEETRSYIHQHMFVVRELSGNV